MKTRRAAEKEHAAIGAAMWRAILVTQDMVRALEARVAALGDPYAAVRAHGDAVDAAMPGFVEETRRRFSAPQKQKTKTLTRFQPCAGATPRCKGGRRGA
jgi:hypothetical protein